LNRKPHVSETMDARLVRLKRPLEPKKITFPRITSLRCRVHHELLTAHCSNRITS